MSDPALAVEHKLVRELGPHVRQGSRWLLAVSGGVDSMVMAEILYRWRRKFGAQMALAHVHHGLGKNSQQNSYRNRAQRLLREWCRERKILLYTNAPAVSDQTSESALRAVRMEHLRAWFASGEFDYVVFAHHADDLLETRLLRLLRGSGRQGLKAMSLARGKILRPQLSLTRAEVVLYAQARRLKWVEDPSNSRSQSSLRNWVRREWLPQLEQRSPGAKHSVARSLSLLAGEEFTETIGPFVGLRRAALRTVSNSRQQEIIARYLRSLGLHGYSKNHVQELIKRLAHDEKRLKFEMLGFSFEATPDFLWASRV